MDQNTNYVGIRQYFKKINEPSSVPIIPLHEFQPRKRKSDQISNQNDPGNASNPISNINISKLHNIIIIH